jgi:Cu+-exporting ATPase
MKTVKILFAFGFLSLVTISCKNEMKKEATEIAEAEKIQTSEVISENITTTKAEFTIEGMTCAMGCAKRIENKLAEMDGVKSAKVDFDKKLAMVEYEDGKITTTSLEETVKGAGDAYSVTEMKTVESFTANMAKHECSETCHKEGCTAEKKKACGDNCTKACCTKKA